MENKFEVGDIVKRLSNRITSNGFELKNIILAKVVRVPNKYAMIIEIIKGDAKYYRHLTSEYKVHSQITIYMDAFELYQRSEEDYDIY